MVVDTAPAPTPEHPVLPGESCPRHPGRPVTGVERAQAGNRLYSHAETGPLWSRYCATGLTEKD